MPSYTFYVAKDKKKLREWLDALPEQQKSEAICEALEMHLPEVIDHRIRHHDTQHKRWQGVKTIHAHHAAQRQAKLAANVDKLIDLLNLGLYPNDDTTKARDEKTITAWVYNYKPELADIGICEEKFISLAVAIIESKQTVEEYIAAHPPIVSHPCTIA